MQRPLLASEVTQETEQAMAGKSNALDELMMACSDLSSGSRRPGFKGPAVRDIRRTEAPRAVFQPSSKARDWRALDQNLESVFGEAGVRAPAPIMASQPLQPLQPPVFQGGQETGDEWGDFQEPTSFNAPVSTSSVSGNNSQSIGCR